MTHLLQQSFPNSCTNWVFKHKSLWGPFLFKPAPCRSQKLSNASTPQAGVGLLVHLLWTHARIFIWLELVEVLRMLSQSLCVHMCICLLWLDNAVSLKSSVDSDSYNLSAPSSVNVERSDTDVPFRAKALKSFIPCMSSSFGSLWFYLKKKLCWCVLNDILIDGYNNKSLGVISMLCFFSRVIIVASPLKPMTYLTTGFFFHFYQCELWGPSWGEGFKSRQKMIG